MYVIICRIIKLTYSARLRSPPSSLNVIMIWLIPLLWQLLCISCTYTNLHDVSGKAIIISYRWCPNIVASDKGFWQYGQRTWRVRKEHVKHDPVETFPFRRGAGQQKGTRSDTPDGAMRPSSSLSGEDSNRYFWHWRLNPIPLHTGHTQKTSTRIL